ncbi:MAG: polysaccharide pyruvyl transferase family protein [Microbacterium sp.]
MRIHAGAALDLTFAAPIAADMSDVFGQVIPAAAPVLARDDYAAIWTVGGEVGSASVEFAYRTAYGEEAFTQLMALSPRERRIALERATEGPLNDIPYLIRPSAHGRPDAALVLNSVGVAGLARSQGARRAILEATLREAAFVSVRDRGSHEALDSLGIAHTVAPDLVHTLPRVHPVSPPDSSYALVQIPEFAIKEHGFEAWVAALASSVPLTRMPIRLFLAGTAPAHDSARTAERIQAALQALTGDEVELSAARGTWARVDEIAQAAMWLGGSLHGRVVAAAYRVPRVSIGSWKVDQYARTWDPGFPLGVTPDSLREAVEFATTMPDRANPEALASQALRSLESAIALLDGWTDVHVQSTHASALLSARTMEAEELHRLAWEADRSEEGAARQRGERFEAEATRLREDRDRWKDEAERLRADRDRWRKKFDDSPEAVSDGNTRA